VALTATFEAGLQVSIRTVARRVTSLVAMVAEVWFLTVLGKVSRVVAPEAPRLLLSAVLGKVPTPVTLQTPQAALFGATAASDTVSGEMANLVAQVTLQCSCVLWFSAGVSHCPSNWTSTSWQSTSANSG